MASRNVIDEIIEIRNRRSSDIFYCEYADRIDSLEKSFKKLPEDNQELLRYFPIALVATMEGCFRVMTSKLIDEGQPFFDNCEKLLNNHKITFDFIKAFKNQHISVGELISHIVSINKIEDINGVLTTLIGKDFLGELKKHYSRWDIEVLGKEAIPMLSNPAETFKNVQRIFELRHIFCHETATKVEFNYEEIKLGLYSVMDFLKVSDSYINEAIYPNAPLTQTDMNIYSYDELNKVIDDINAVRISIKNELKTEPKRLKHFDLSHKNWLKYMSSFSAFHAGMCEGGTIYPLLYNGTASNLANNYLESLKNELKHINMSGE